MICLGVWCLSVISCKAENGDINGKLFLEGIRFYQAGAYDSASDAFLKIVESGVINGKLFYNLGNSYLKQGILGGAILWYERALKLNPSDPELRFNLDYARTLLSDKQEEGYSTLGKAVFFWQNVMSQRTIQFAAVALNLVFWLMLTIKAIVRPQIMKPGAFRVMRAFMLCMALIFTFTAFFQIWEDNFIKRAVIITEISRVRSGVSESATELFVLNVGTKVIIDQTTGDFYRIAFSKNKIGWLKKTDAAVI
jgi:tetratricopeptide (TPR) repeat protein